MRISNSLSRLGAAGAAMFLSSAVWAESELPALNVIGQPIDGAMNFQPSRSLNKHDMVFLDNLVHLIGVGIAVLVLGLLLVVILRFNESKNKVPARFTHNSPLEVTWTVGPIIVLVVIGAFSLPILYNEQTMPSQPDVTIKATGHMWHWQYEYVDNGIDFRSFLLDREDLEAHGYEPHHYLLATDNAMVVPVGRTVVVQVTASDVIHAWTIPSFGVKQDAVPGRLGQLWFAAEEEGVYFGQCSELCGAFHAYMPITVKVVSDEEYEAWILRRGGTPTLTEVAQAD